MAEINKKNMKMSEIDKAVSILFNESKRILEDENPTIEGLLYSKFLLDTAIELKEYSLGGHYPGMRLFPDE